MVTKWDLLGYPMAHSWAGIADVRAVGLGHDGTSVGSPQVAVPAWGVIYETLASVLRGIGNCGGALGFQASISARSGSDSAFPKFWPAVGFESASKGLGAPRC